ncbi:MAG: MerR family transcriptional regulator [Paludibacteraceae bacterium]|nr:MerR family transcriptional regulator [Paludibacteraceae bacterium]
MSDKVYYSMREAQQMTGLPASTLRYWEQQFDELNPRKDGHGNRYYTEANLDIVRRIKYLRDEMHITRIDAIRNELRQGTKQVDVRLKAADLLAQVRSELAALRARL